MISSIFVMKEGQQRLLTLPDGHLGRESGDVVRFSVVFAVSVPGSAACWSGLGLLGGIPASWELQSDPLLKKSNKAGRDSGDRKRNGRWSLMKVTDSGKPQR